MVVDIDIDIDEAIKLMEILQKHLCVYETTDNSCNCKFIDVKIKRYRTAEHSGCAETKEVLALLRSLRE